MVQAANEVARALEKRISDEIIRQSTEAGLFGSAAAAAVTMAFALIVGPYLPSALVLSWVVFSLTGCAWRVWVALRVRRQGIPPGSAALIASGAASGLVWGLAGVVFLPQLQQVQASVELGFIAAAIITGMPAGAVSSYGRFYRSYLAYVLCSIVPFGVVNLATGQQQLVLTGIASMIYATFMLRMSHGQTTSSQQSLVQQIALTDLNESLTRARDAAEAASRAKSSFLANMSHEIRTPLNAVIGISELMQGVTDNPKARQYANTIRRSASSLLGVISDVLDLSRIEAGGMSLRPESFNLQGLLREVVDMFSPVAQTKGLDLQLEIGPAVPQAVQSDPVRLRQVLVNLVGNALKFTERGAVTLRANAVSATDTEARVCLEVIDSGIGISPEDCAKLFKPFAQAAHSRGGTGLGLAITADLVALMGGRLEVSSEIGQGSVFRAWISVGLLPDAGLPVGGDDAPPPALDYPVHVLLVEDNEVNQLVASEMLERLACRCSVANSGEAALAMLPTSSFDLVLMDCQMPGLDGFETTRRWRLQELALGKQRTPVVALTASSLTSDRERCFEAGMDDYLSKPVSGARIREMIVRWAPRPGGTQ